MFEALHWFLPALNAPERAAMLAGMQQGMPPEPFRAVLDIAQRTLAPQDHAKLHARARPARRARAGDGLISARASARHVDQLQRPRQAQPEAAAAGLLQPHAGLAVDQAPRQQHQARLEVVADLGQADLGRQAQFAVGELGAAALRRGRAAASTAPRRPRP